MSEDKPVIEVQPNTLVIINPSANNYFGLEANGDRVIIQEDKMKFGNECKTCDGEGVINEPCPPCQGTGFINGADNEKFPCRECHQQRGVFGQQESQGLKTCPDCRGKGGLVVIPQNLERRPTSGTVKSIGPDVGNCKFCGGAGRILIQGIVGQQKTLELVSVQPLFANCPPCSGSGKVGLKLKVGDRVIYPIFAGTAINFKQKGTCRIMHENEIMGKIYGIGNLGDIIK